MTCVCQEIKTIVPKEIHRKGIRFRFAARRRVKVSIVLKERKLRIGLKRFFFFSPSPLFSSTRRHPARKVSIQLFAGTKDTLPINGLREEGGWFPLLSFLNFFELHLIRFEHGDRYPSVYMCVSPDRSITCLVMTRV